ncbi:diguanylate cyclase [bacterium]|nr:diguanylate cyclase [bacterium]
MEKMGPKKAVHYIESIIKSLGDGVIVVSPEEKVIFMNPAAKGMLKVKGDSSPFLEEMKRGILKDLSKKRKGIKRREIGVKSEILEVKATPLEVENGKLQGAVAILRNVTRAKEVDRMKTEFVSSVSHELRTPLTSLQESVSLLLDGTLGDLNEEQKEFLGMANLDVMRLGRLISDLLDISRIEAGRMELHRTPTSVISLSNRSRKSLLPLARDKGVELVSLLPLSLPLAYIDADRIGQVFTNLIENAVKFTPKGGKVILNANPRSIDKGKFLEIVVEDTGIGIAGEDLARIFDKFHQLSRVPGPGSKGTGLGLAISKNIVEMHRGKIWVESKPGKGSRFIFTVPKYKMAAFSPEHLSEQIRESKKRNVPFCLFIVKVKNAESIKDKCTKRDFENVLIKIESLLKDEVRHPDDIVARFGEEGIALILTELDRKDSHSVEKRIKGLLESRTFDAKGKEVKVSIDIGSVSFPEDAPTKEKLLKKIMKLGGRGMLAIFTKGNG